MLERLSDRLFSAASPRYRAVLRRLAPVVAVAFLIFELSRFLAVVPMLSPAWDIVRDDFAGILARRPAAMITGLTVAALAFIIPMAGVVWGLRWLHRRLFHKGTAG